MHYICIYFIGSYTFGNEHFKTIKHAANIMRLLVSGCFGCKSYPTNCSRSISATFVFPLIVIVPSFRRFTMQDNSNCRGTYRDVICAFFVFYHKPWQLRVFYTTYDSDGRDIMLFPRHVLTYPSLLFFDVAEINLSAR